MLPKNSLQNQIALLCVALIVVCCLALLITFALFTRQNHMYQVEKNFVYTQNVFRQYLQTQEDVLTTAAQVLTSDFGFKQAVATRDAATIASVLANHGARIGADLMWLTDLDGRLISADLGEQRNFDEVLLDLMQTPGEGFFVVLDDTLYQVILLPVKAPRTIAYTLVGFEIDAEVTTRLRDLTGLEISFFDAHQHLLSSSLPLAKNSDFIEEMQTRALPGIFRSRPEFSNYQLALNAVPGRPVGVLISNSLADFYQELDAQLRTTLVLAGLTILLGLTASVFMARNLTVPLAQLVVMARRFAQGDYADRVLHRQANDEIRSLFNAFAEMGQEIQIREQQVLYQAQHDSLTGLWNRSSLLTLLDEVTRAETRFLLVTANVRGFQHINNSLGPDMGDLCLCAVAARLKVRTGQYARVGGDEFVALLPLTPTDDRQTVIQQLLNSLHQPLQVADFNIKLVFRAGACEFPADGAEGKTLLRRATIALEAARSEDVNARFYQNGEDEKLLERLAIVEALKLAMQKDDGQLFMYYQPKLNLRTGCVDKVESLIRWRRPGNVWVSPELFISLAEQTGLIIELSQWVVRSVMRQVRQWQADGIHIHAAINISAQDLNHPDFLPFLTGALAEYQLQANCITLELTERDLMSNELQAISLLTELKSRGFSVSVDDYGIGQSSLGKLKKLPVDELKIDKSFILKLDSSATDQMIVQSTITLGHNLGLMVVAEGVENETSLQLLRKMGADAIQGYFLCRPFAAAELKPWLEHYHALSKQA